MKKLKWKKRRLKVGNKYKEPKSHLLVDGNRAICGKIVFGTMLGTHDKNQANCRICVEKIALEAGKIDDWKVGGQYDKTGGIRRNTGARPRRS
jgi:hypothetical protein